MAKRTYASLQDWMERTGKNQAYLLALVNKHTTVKLGRVHLSRILTGSVRCSIEKALALSLVTGVPVENLVKWPRVAREELNGAPAETGQI